MKTQENNSNSIFTYTFTGALLFIGAIACMLAGIPTIELSYSIGAILGISSLSLLYKAVKEDRERLRQL